MMEKYWVCWQSGWHVQYCEEYVFLTLISSFFSLILFDSSPSHRDVPSFFLYLLLIHSYLLFLHFHLLPSHSVILVTQINSASHAAQSLKSENKVKLFQISLSQANPKEGGNGALWMHINIFKILFSLLPLSVPSIRMLVTPGNTFSLSPFKISISETPASQIFQLYLNSGDIYDAVTKSSVISLIFAPFHPLPRFSTTTGNSGFNSATILSS